MTHATPAAGGKTPIIISGGSITVQSLLISSQDKWENYRADHQTFQGIPVSDASVLQFFPSSADGTKASETYTLAEDWKVVVFVKEDSSKTQQLVVQGHPGKRFTVRTSHTFSSEPHTAIPGYDGRSFCECKDGNPDDFHIDEIVKVTGMLGSDNNPLPEHTFRCDDVTCRIHIGTSPA